ncbi:uncharacterized protein I303_106130 [Kwoniella dejecticola CBS 10117]|uniref:Uncharacterized protein n=1 Tax=Kwoniella dejecticola CBS 10117 TaxID=1296121 RepID=A0AAJ8KTZ6_9TREE
MSSSSIPINFTPKHAQPFTLEEAMHLGIETLVAEIKRLENSINHLRRTQSELRSYLESEEGKADEGEDGEGEIGLAYKENEDTISSQSERITLIKLALLNKLGSDARLEHYGLTIEQDIKPSNTDRNNDQQPPPHPPRPSSSSASSHPTTQTPQQPIRSEEISPDRLPREIVHIQGGGSVATTTAGTRTGTTSNADGHEDDDGLHL